MTKTKRQQTSYRTPMTVDQFADRVHTLHSSVVHGDDPAAAAKKARDSWRLLDPIETAKGSDAQRGPRMVAALGKAVVIAGEVSDKRARDWPVESFRTGLLLDQAGTEIKQGTADDITKEHLGHVVASAESGRGHKDVEAKFDALSAKAMLLHMESRELQDKKVEPWQRRGTEAILRASLGGLIKESVGGLREMHKGYQAAITRGGNGSHLSGRLVETMYFTYKLMEWYKSEGSLGSGYPRFALHREDKPLIKMSPPRSFDVGVMHTDAEPELVQIKATHNASYAEGITVWRPQKEGVVDETEQVMGWFDAIVDNERSEAEMQGAWRNLNARFADPAEAH